MIFLTRYEFKCGNRVFLYTSQKHDVGDYKACPLKHSNIIISGNIRKSQVKISAPANFEISELFRRGAPSLPVFVKIIGVWYGRVVAVEWGRSGSTLVCESFYSSVQTNANLRIFDYTCPLALYSDKCGVVAENFSVGAHDVFAGFSNQDLLLTLNIRKPSYYFNGGFIHIEYTNLKTDVLRILDDLALEDEVSYETNPEDRFNHYIYVDPPVSESPDYIQSATLYPGCKHTIDDCKNKFNNVANYGGFPWIPGKNPFDGVSTIFW